MSNLIPIEFKNKRILTTEQLAEVYETEPRRITENFSRNEKHFTEGAHYYLLQGEELREFKSQYAESVVAKTTSKLYLWTERGANRHCKILDTDKAWEQFDNLEETYFRVKENSFNLTELSPNLQMFNQLFQTLAKNELEQKRIKHEIAAAKEETAAVKQEVQGIRDVIALNPNSWKTDINNILSKIAIERGGTTEAYREVRNESYKLLNERAGAKLEIRLTNRRRKVLEETGSKSKADKVSKLDVIADDKRLTEVYIAIVKEMAIKYKVA